ncbi:hypothetical protein EJD97_007802, partial [Solanum chilense]
IPLYEQLTTITATGTSYAGSGVRNRMGTPKPESISRLRVILLLCRNRWYCKIFSEFLENQLDGILHQNTAIKMNCILSSYIKMLVQQVILYKQPT